MTAPPALQQPLFPTALPRSTSFTDALLAAAPDVVDAGTAQRLRASFIRRTVRTAGTQSGSIRLDGHLLRRAFEPGLGGSAHDEPFRWSPGRARRMVGLAAVRACVHGTRRTPAQAVTTVVEELCRQGADPHERVGSLASWLAASAPGVRALVRAEAVTWATQLHGALDWSRLAPLASVGGPDEWWDHRPSGITMRGRAEVRIRPAPHAGDARSGRVLVSVLNGRPGSHTRAELGLGALVSVLAQPMTSPPVRVAGWWPASGRALVLPVDAALLETTVDTVALALEAVRPARARTSATWRRAS